MACLASPERTARRVIEDGELLLSRVALQATWELGLATGMVSWSGAFATIFGYAPSEIAGTATC